MSFMRQERRARWGLLLVVALLPAVIVVSPAEAAPRRVGAGQNNPNFNDWYARTWYSCTDEGNFKIDRAKIVMWSNGNNRVKGFHFKYRIVPAGTEGQPVPYSNWSPNATMSFDQGTVLARWMSSGAQGQAWSPAADWDLEIKLKYPRSLRTAYRYKYRTGFVEPSCAG